MKLVIIDTNVLLRYWLKDHPQESPRAKKLFEQAQQGEIKVVVPQIVVIEAGVVLRRYYKYSNQQVVDYLLPVISRGWLEIESRSLLLEALGIYKVRGIDLVDAFLLAQSQAMRAKLMTFDKKLARLAK